MNAYEQVTEFHQIFGHPVGTEDLANAKFVRLRLNLIFEEFMELVEACGYDRRMAVTYGNPMTGRLYFDHTRETYDIVEVADALGDIEYVVNGFAVALGLNLPKIVDEIHDSNMSKLGEDGKPIYRADGKIMKGPSYRKPDIKKVIEA